MELYISMADNTDGDMAVFSAMEMYSSFSDGQWFSWWPYRNYSLIFLYAWVLLFFMMDYFKYTCRVIVVV